MIEQTCPWELCRRLVRNASKLENKREIKIRYAYIASPTTMRIDSLYHETLKFKVLTVEQLETRSFYITLAALITDNKAALIRILGRDRCTELNDMNGMGIYENDIIRWYPNRPKNHTDVTVEYFCNRFILGDWYDEDFPDTEKCCKVIGNVYENHNRRINE